MKRLVTVAFVCVLSLAACGSDDDLGPVFVVDPFTAAGLQGAVLGLIPDSPVGGIDRWEYEFGTSTVKGCNIERTYNATSWTLVDSRTVKVFFGQQWEQYRLVNYTGTVAGGDLGGSFEYTSSPGVTMTGTIVQQTSTLFC